jgi:hypothetical protein
VAVPNSGHKRRHLLGWSSDDEGSDSEEPSFNGVNKGSRGIAVPAREQATDVVTRGRLGAVVKWVVVCYSNGVLYTCVCERL